LTVLSAGTDWDHVVKVGTERNVGVGGVFLSAGPGFQPVPLSVTIVPI